MYHERNIGFVDTHPECVRRDHDLAPIVYEIVLIGNAFLIGKSCVVSRRRKSPGFKEFADGLHVFSLRAVYYAGLSLRFARVFRSCRSLLSGCITVNDRFGLSKLVVMQNGSSSSSSVFMSSFTSGVAVAVKAPITGLPGSSLTNSAIRR